jgi:hypothetical protein
LDINRSDALEVSARVVELAGFLPAAPLRMTPRRSGKAVSGRRGIVAAATELFRECGVDAVGLNEVMKHAGFTQGGLYDHFESKAALVAEVLASPMVKGAAENLPRTQEHLPIDQPLLFGAT